MKVWAAAAISVLVGQLAVPTVGMSQDEQARRYERLMTQAAELRQKAEHLRSEADEKGQLGAARARAKSLDQQADALEKNARNAEPSGWPPS